MYNHHNHHNVDGVSYLLGFHEVTQTHGGKGEIPTWDQFLGRLSSMTAAAFTLCSVGWKLFIMFIPSSTPFKFSCTSLGQNWTVFRHHHFQIPLVSQTGMLYASPQNIVQVSANWTLMSPKKSHSWYQCIFKGRQWLCKGSSYRHRSYIPPSKHWQSHPSFSYVTLSHSIQWDLWTAWVKAPTPKTSLWTSLNALDSLTLADWLRLSNKARSRIPVVLLS